MNQKPYNKKTFLTALAKNLKKLKTCEIQRHINYYDELLSDIIENGLSEEEAAFKIGFPQDIAQEILSNAAPEDFRKKDIPGIILISLSLLLFIASLLFYITAPIPHSIPIIGGADGPTSIFIAGKIGTSDWIYKLAGGCIGITILYKIIRLFKK